MRAVARVSLCALACTGLIVAAAWGFGGWQIGTADDLDLAGAGRRLMAEVRKEADLTVRNQASVRRLAGKQQVVDELLTGGLTLQEAGDAFRRLNDETSEAGAGAADATVGAGAAASNEALYCNVLVWADCTAAQEPNRAGRVAQLHAELHDLLHEPLHGA